MFEELRAHRDEIEEMGRRYGVVTPWFSRY
jgi:hypothetical protein